MGESNSGKPGSRPGAPSSGLTTPTGGDKPVTPTDDTLAGRSGRVVHDERGNAVWRWVKETGRHALDSTSHLLKRLELPELKVEDSDDNSLSLEADRRDAGGGYDPYGGSSSPKPSAGKVGPGADRGSSGQGGGSGLGGRGPGQGSGSVFGGRAPGQGSSSGSSSRGPGGNVGGGYDPYGKDLTRKPGRKP